MVLANEKMNETFGVHNYRFNSKQLNESVQVNWMRNLSNKKGTLYRLHPKPIKIVLPYLESTMKIFAKKNWLVL
jgi:hypothetical protein